MSDSPGRGRLAAAWASRPFYWRPVLVIAVVWVALVAGIRLVLDYDAAVVGLATKSAHLLMSLVLAGWFLFFAGLPVPLRRGLLAVLVLGAVGFAAAVRIEGWTGNMSPILAWRWSPPRDVLLAREASRRPQFDAPPAAPLTTTPNDFPQFHGPRRDAILAGPKLARDWDARPPRIVWKQPIGAGWSGFAIVGDRAFTQEQRGSEELVTCYDLPTGRLLWSHADELRYVSAVGGDGPRGTPTVIDGRVYTLGGTARLNCLDAATGKLLWTHDVLREAGVAVDVYPFPNWGKSCSPLVDGDDVIVSAGGPKGWSLVSYDRNSGKLRWRVGDERSSYASPVLATLRGQRQLLMLNAAGLTSHDPDREGAILWTYAWPGDAPKIPDPLPLDDERVLVAVGYGLGAVLLKIDRADAKPAWTASEVWKSKQFRPKMASIIVRDGHAYSIDDGRSLNCLNLADGKTVWRSARAFDYGHGQLLAVGDLLLVTCESGDLALVEVAPRPDGHRELGRVPVFADKTWNNPALSGNRLLMRNDREAALIELPLAEE